jgi:long-chain acyl-CoA synthetase
MYYTELHAVREELSGPGGPFEIVEAEVLGNRIRTYKNQPPSIRELWLSTAVFAERTYIIYEGERLTYSDAHTHVNAIAAWLAEQGVKPGDRVAIAMRNYPEWMPIYWACVSTGIAVVGMNAWWTAEEMEYAIRDSAPKLLFLDAERLARFREKPELAGSVQLVGVRIEADYSDVTPYSSVIAHGGAMPDVAVDPDADACIFYTSGTTGYPKGAQLTHRGCVANLFSLMYAATASALAVQRATGEAPPETPPIPVTLVTTPCSTSPRTIVPPMPRPRQAARSC